MTVSAAAPTGIERTVAPDELFFSTTDRQGVIRYGNSAFVRVSGHSVQALTGAPHSVVRHPDMPAGAYRLMWDRLLQGRPMGAFVKNLARDGSHYWLFATVTPLGEGFLSVRMAPRSALFDPIKQLYLQVRAAERDAAQHEGLDRRSAAALGAHLVEDGLRSLGFETYDDFILEALPAEIASRPRLVQASYARPWLGGSIGDILDAAAAIEGQLTAHVERLDGYRVLSDRLTSSATDVLEVARRLDRSVSAARRASGQVAESVPVLLNVATVMSQPMHVTVTALDRLAPRLQELRKDIASLRFRIALASLHDDMVAAFAAEVGDGAAPPNALEQVPLLCDAVHDGVADMARRARSVDGELADVAQLVSEASERLDEFRRFLGQWRILAMRHRAASGLGELMQPIDEEIAAGHQMIVLLRTLGEQCRSATVPLDAGALDAQVGRIRTAAAGPV
jgi:PAS domain S-box-containing protein